MKSSLDYQHNIDEIFYAHAGKIPLANRVSFLARKRVISLFFEVVKPDQNIKVLDIGTSEEISVEANMLEQLFPFRENLVCASITPGKNIVKAYPGVKHVQIEPNTPLPFSNNAFDIGYSNAVLEHVGNRDKQRFFVEEICRVSKFVFLVVPNRSFPVEHHTGIPLLHWLPSKLFRRILRQTPWSYWAEEEHLNYVSAEGLCDIWPCQAPLHISYEGVGISRFKSNLIAYGPTQ